MISLLDLVTPPSSGGGFGIFAAIISGIGAIIGLVTAFFKKRK